jgi:hypothetical protein
MGRSSGPQPSSQARSAARCSIGEEDENQFEAGHCSVTRDRRSHGSAWEQGLQASPRLAILHQRHLARRTWSGHHSLINSSSNSNDVTIPTFVPFAEAVHFVFEGHGKFSGSSTADYGGTIFPVTFIGTYSVKHRIAPAV